MDNDKSIAIPKPAYETQLQTAPIGALTNTMIVGLDSPPSIVSVTTFKSIDERVIVAIYDHLQNIEDTIQDALTNAEQIYGPYEADIVSVLIGIQGRSGKIKSLLARGCRT